MSFFLGQLTGRTESVRGRNGVQYSNEVDPGLIDGSAFRVYKRFAANTVIKFEATAPFVLNSQSLSLMTGQAVLTVYTDSTGGGTFTVVPTNFSKNQVLSPPAVSTVTVSAGGTRTGGQERDQMICRSGTSVGNSSSSAALGQGDRVLPAGIYYMDIVVTGTTDGMWSVEYSTLTAP